MDDGQDGKFGKSERPVADSIVENSRASAEGPQQVAAHNEKVRDNSESDSTVNNDDVSSNTRKKESETVQVPKDAREESDEDAVFAHLPEHEKAILKEQLHIPDVKVTFAGLYRYASKNDLIILAISAICAIGAGAIMPLFTVCCRFPFVAHSLPRRCSCFNRIPE